MAIRFADPVSQYTTPHLTDLWTQATTYLATGNPAEPSIVAGAGPRGGSAIHLQDLGTGPSMGLEKTLVPVGNTAIVGCSFKATTGSTGGVGFSALRTQANGGNSVNMLAANAGANDSVINQICSIKKSYYTQVTLSLNTNGTITALTGNANSFSSPFTGQDRIGAVLGTTALSLLFEQWYSLELVVLTHASAGTLQLYVNDVLWLDLSGIKTIAEGGSASAGWQSFHIGAPLIRTGLPIAYRYADLRTLDTDTSDAFNNLAAKIGPAAIDVTMPTADGAHTDWTPKSAGTHFSEVDEIPPDDDTSYNETTGVGDIDSFVQPGVPITGVTIVAVGVMANVKSVDGGASETQMGVRIGGTDYLIGASEGNTASFSYQQGFVNNKPSDGLPFSEAQFAATEPLYKKTV